MSMSANGLRSTSDHPTHLRQVARFLAVGALATGCHYLILLWLVLSFEFSATVASCTGFIVSACVNYYLSHSFTFKSSRAHVWAIPSFAAIAGVGLLLNAGIMELLIEQVNIHYFAAQVCATISILLWSFMANRIWTFGSMRTP